MLQNILQPVIHPVFGVAEASPSTLLDGLVSWWSLDETSGTRFDAHGSIDLTDTNTVGYAAGKVSNAADFEDTNTEYFSNLTASSLDPSGGDITIAGWIKPESLDSVHNYIFDYAQDPTGATAIALLISRDDFPTYPSQVVADVYSTDSNETFIGEGTTLSAGTWYFILFSFTASSSEIAISLNNGTPATTTLGGSGDLRTSLGYLKIGIQQGDTQPFDGLIDELAVWTRLLTSAEITELYNSGNGIAYPGEGPSYLVQDTFTGSDSTALSLHTPDVDTVGGGWTEHSGTWEILSNECVNTDNTDDRKSSIDSGASDVIVEHANTVRIGGGASYTSIGTVTRLSDATHHWLTLLISSNSTFTIYENNAGYTLRATTAKAQSDNTKYAVKTQCNGTTITAWVDGGSEISYASASLNQTETRHGISCAYGSSPPGVARADNFTVTAIPYLVKDTFTDSDTTALTAHTPDIDTVGGGWIVGAGTWTIQSNRASGGGAGSMAVVETSVANVQAELTAQFDTANASGTIVRYSDTNNLWINRITNNSHTIYERNGGSWTLRAGNTPTITGGTDYALKITASGSTITSWVDAANQISYASATHNQTATKHGIVSDAGTHQHDNFKVTAL